MDNSPQEKQEIKSLSKALQPLYFALVLIAGILLGVKLSANLSNNNSRIFSSATQNNKVNELLNYVQQNYVDTISKNRLLDETIISLLQNLDPHSAYIPASELAQTNEMLQGNFDGIGIEFNILNDTIYVVSSIAGGPSEQLGIRAGDRIIKVEKKNVAGIKITNKEVFKLLRGIGGTKVNISILRRGNKSPLAFSITRGKIPIYSVDASFMLNDNKTGVIKIGRFAQTTYEEYLKAFNNLEKQGMKQLIVDLRGNPGGFLNIATKLCDEFLEDKKLIVYTEGHARRRENFYATDAGYFEKNKVAFLIDEGSASASEILAGAIQDNDRGVIVGRRSFGKGLVQEQSDFSDGSALRLTIARYYTPTGRCIQKPYTPGELKDYAMEEMHRYKSGELENKDSIKFSDSLKFKTPKGKVVYGGGGIMPDIFVPIDTTKNSSYLTELYITGIINQFAVEYSDKNRDEINKFNSMDDYISKFNIDDKLINEFTNYAAKNNIPRNEIGLKKSISIIKLQLKALIARGVWHNDAYYKVLSLDDKTVNEALKALK